MTPLEAVQSDAESLLEGVTIALVTDRGEHEIIVPLVGRWRTRAISLLRQGDSDGWAEVVLSEDDLATWLGADPTVENVEAFFLAWEKASGENRGKLPRSPGGSKATRRR